QREHLGQRFPGIALFAAPTSDALADAELVVFAVKPQQMAQACAALAPHVASVRAALSIAAGTRIADIARWLGGYRRIVRAMPNTPAAMGAGIRRVFASPDGDDAGRARAGAVLDAAGEVVWCETEAQLDAVTGISGSGPAYVFY